MKFLYIFLVFVAGANAHLDKTATYWNECLLEHGTTNMEMKTAITSTEKMHTLGCVLSCLLEKLELVSAEGLLSPDEMIHLLEHIAIEKGLNVSNNVKEYILECAEDANSSSFEDQCVRSMNFVKCLKVHVAASIFS